MADDKVTEAQSMGCVLIAWSVLVTGPMWFVLLFQLLKATEMPGWVWALYWCYLPAHLLGAALAGLFRLLNAKGA